MNSIKLTSALNELKKFGIIYEYSGDKDYIITCAKSLSEFCSGCISFFRGNNVDLFQNTNFQGGLLIVRPSVARLLDTRINLISVDNPDLAFCIITKKLLRRTLKGIHNTAIIDKTALLGKNVCINSYAVIRDNVIIEDNVIIDEGVILKNCIIGRGSHIFPGVKIGSAGLGSHKDSKGRWHHFPHFKNVIIGHDVIIQDNSVIARGSLSDTIINDGVAIGPMTWVAHGVQIEKNAWIAQEVTLAGSVRVGQSAVIWGNASVRDGVSIGPHAVIGMGSVVISNVPDSEVWVGNPARRLVKER